MVFYHNLCAIVSLALIAQVTALNVDYQFSVSTVLSISEIDAIHLNVADRYNFAVHVLGTAPLQVTPLPKHMGFGIKTRL
jgi:hypothetical protein